MALLFVLDAESGLLNDLLQHVWVHGNLLEELKVELLIVVLEDLCESLWEFVLGRVEDLFDLAFAQSDLVDLFDEVYVFLLEEDYLLFELRGGVDGGFEELDGVVEGFDVLVELDFDVVAGLDVGLESLGEVLGGVLLEVLLELVGVGDEVLGD